MVKNEGDSNHQTPYQRVLTKAREIAEVGRNRPVEERLANMIAAVEQDRYDDLVSLWRGLPPAYRVVIGNPPGSRDDDVWG